MGYHYNESVWGPSWIWAFGALVFLSGIILAIWFYQMARAADSDDVTSAPPRRITRGGPGSSGPSA